MTVVRRIGTAAALGLTLGAAGCATRVEHEPLVGFTPPVLLNRDEVTSALAGRPSEGRARIVLWLYVDTAGYPARIQIRTGTGDAGLDSAAVRVAQIMEFQPARRDHRVVAAWIEQALVFVPTSELPLDVRARREARLLNDVAVVEELRTRYRHLSGAAQVWLAISEGGRVDDVRVLEATDAQVARAAGDAARMLRFAAARGRAVDGASRPVEAKAVYRLVFGPQGTVRPAIADLDRADPAALVAASPYDVPPRASDPDRLRRRVSEAWVEHGGPGAVSRAVLYVFVGPDGEPVVAHVRGTTGRPRLDRALRDAARSLEFEPALRGGEPVGAWLELPMSPHS